jgi:hypothetical protein
MTEAAPTYTLGDRDTEFTVSLSSAFYYKYRVTPLVIEARMERDDGRAMTPWQWLALTERTAGLLIDALHHAYPGIGRKS